MNKTYVVPIIVGSLIGVDVLLDFIGHLETKSEIQHVQGSVEMLRGAVGNPSVPASNQPTVFEVLDEILRTTAKIEKRAR
jgi:hypothetical protein